MSDNDRVPEAGAWSHVALLTEEQAAHALQFSPKSLRNRRSSSLGPPRRTESCNGCAPAEARGGDLPCPRCYGRLGRSTTPRISSEPSVLGRARSRHVYEKVLVSGSLGDGIPAPVDADLIEAADALTRGLQGWADWAERGSMPAYRGLRAGSEADVAQQIVLDATTTILDATWRRGATQARPNRSRRWLTSSGPARRRSKRPPT